MYFLNTYIHLSLYVSFVLCLVSFYLKSSVVFPQLKSISDTHTRACEHLCTYTRTQSLAGLTSPLGFSNKSFFMQLFVFFGTLFGMHCLDLCVCVCVFPSVST